DALVRDRGRGVYLVRRLMDKVDYLGRGNAVRLTRKLNLSSSGENGEHEGALCSVAPDASTDPQDPAHLALTLSFPAPMEEIVIAMWKEFRARVKALPREEARIDPAPSQGVQCLNLPLEITAWPDDTEPWFANRWRNWMAHHSWVVAA